MDTNIFLLLAEEINSEAKTKSEQIKDAKNFLKIMQKCYENKNLTAEQLLCEISQHNKKYQHNGYESI